MIKVMYLPCCFWDIVAYFLPTLPLYCDIACCYLQTVAMVTQWRSATTLTVLAYCTHYVRTLKNHLSEFALLRMVRETKLEIKKK